MVLSPLRGGKSYNFRIWVAFRFFEGKNHSREGGWRTAAPPIPREYIYSLCPSPMDNRVKNPKLTECVDVCACEQLVENVEIPFLAAKARYARLERMI